MLLVIELVVQDVLGHAQEERGVGACTQVHPHVGLARGGAETRVEAHELRAGLLRIEHATRPHHARLHQVAVRQDDHVRLRPLPHVVEREHTRPGKGLALAIALTHIVAVESASLGSQDAREKRRETLARLGGILNPEGFFPILVLRRLEVLGDHLECLIPANSLEFPAAALSYAFHWGLDARFAVNVLNLGNALQADVLEPFVLVGPRLHHNETAIAHGALEHAIAQAMLVVVRERGGFGRRFVGQSLCRP